MSDRKVKSSPRRRIATFVNQLALWILAIVFLIPLVYMVGASLKAPSEIFSVPPTIFGKTLQWSNYSEALNYAPFGKYLLNSLFIAACGTIVNATVGVLAGYAFSRLVWRGRTVTFMLFLATMMIPQEVLVVPSYVLMQQFGWVNTYQALILPTAFSAFSAFMLRQFFMSVPRELEEAARVDGAGVWKTFRTIMLPLAVPTLAVVSVFTFIGYWNAFLWPLIVINDVSSLGTVPLGLQQFFGQQGSQWHLVMAASVISMLPMILLVVALQKHLVKAEALGEGHRHVGIRGTLSSDFGRRALSLVGCTADALDNSTSMYCPVSGGVTRKFRTVGLCSGSPGEGWRVVGFELGGGLVADR